MATKKSHLPIALIVDLILVVLFTIVGHYTHSHNFDPQGLMTTAWPFVAALVIAALIVPRAFLILRSAVRILMEAVPAWLDLDDLERHLLENPHVQGIHDLHVTKIGTGLPVLTAHVEVEPECFTDSHADEVLADLRACVRDHFEERI